MGYSRVYIPLVSSVRFSVRRFLPGLSSQATPLAFAVIFSLNGYTLMS